MEQLFRDKGFVVRSVQDRARKFWHEYDFLAEKDGVCKTYEVKNDMAGSKYGNIAIEFAQGRKNKKPSGIMTSKSDYWVHFVHGWNKYFVVETSVLRHWMMQVILDGAECRIHRNGGDNGNDIMLIPVRELIKQTEIWGSKVVVRQIPEFIIQDCRDRQC